MRDLTPSALILAFYWRKKSRGRVVASRPLRLPSQGDTLSGDGH